MADKLNTNIDGKQPAKLSHGEFVIPADVVSHLGNGNSDAGADVLYKMMDKIRRARTGNPKQGKRINPEKFTPGGIAGYAGGGAVAFDAGGVTPAAKPAVSGAPTNVESSLSNWAGPYVTDMLGRGQALANQPYQAYTGQLTAGSSGLQDQAFAGLGSLQNPAAMGRANQTVADAAARMGNLSYTPTGTGSFDMSGLTYSPVAASTAGINAPVYDQSIGTSQFTGDLAKQYMNPNLWASLDPQLEEARRQSQITQMVNNAKASQAGAYGGSASTLMNAETQRNLGTNLASITGKGFSEAYDKGMGQFNAEQARKLQAGQFGATYGLSAEQARAAQSNEQQAQNAREAQFAANYGLNTRQAQATQFNAEQNRKAQESQFAASYGLDALRGQATAGGVQGQLANQENQMNLANISAQLAGGTAQRGIESEALAAQQAAYEKERMNPYAQVQFQQSLLQGLPIGSSTATTATTGLQDLTTNIKNLLGLSDTVGITGKP
jgi:hypothetical protein